MTLTFILSGLDTTPTFKIALAFSVSKVLLKSDFKTLFDY